MAFKEVKSKKIAILFIAIGFILLIFSGMYLQTYILNIHRHHIPIHKLADVNAIEDWMTIHYIARAYSVPEYILLQTASVNTQNARSKSIAAIASMQQEDPATLIAALRSTIIQYKIHVSPTITRTPGK